MVTLSASTLRSRQDLSSLLENTTAQAYPRWMGAILPVFNIIRRIFGFEQLVNYAIPSLQNRSIVILRSDANRLERAILKNQQDQEHFATALNSQLPIPERKEACDLLDDGDEKTRLNETICQYERQLKQKAFNASLAKEVRQSAANLLSREDQERCTKEIKFDAAKVSALTKDFSISQRLGFLIHCKEADKASILEVIKQDQQAYLAIALDTHKDIRLRQAYAMKLPREEQTQALLKIQIDLQRQIATNVTEPYGRRLQAIQFLPQEERVALKAAILRDVKTSALDKKNSIETRLKCADLLEGEEKIAVVQIIRWDHAALKILAERAKQPKPGPIVILSEEQMAKRTASIKKLAADEFQKRLVLLKGAMKKEQMTPSDHPRALCYSMCPKMYLRLQEQFNT